MANAREISTRIKSIQDTMKITKAMYMMSSMELRKAGEYRTVLLWIAGADCRYSVTFPGYEASLLR